MNLPQKTTERLPENYTDLVANYPIQRIAAGQSEWRLHMAFGVSHSPNYEKAVKLARGFRSYRQTGHGKALNHVITIGCGREEFLRFIILYEMVKGWRSTLFSINDELVDPKTIGTINFCYGDKCRSVKEEFCFGASAFTANPFGCHRLQISQYNRPWWSFYLQKGKGYTLDEARLSRRIQRTHEAYRHCPAFDLDYIQHVANLIPKKLTQAEYAQLMKIVRDSYLSGYE